MSDALPGGKAAVVGADQPAPPSFSHAPYQHLTIPPFELTRKKVAIVGFASTTRHMAPYHDKDWEIWGLNEAHRHPEWMSRITRWFQMHDRWDYTKQNDKAYRDHWEWLQKSHPFPIYMKDEWPDIPSSVKYPLGEVAKLVGEIYHGERRTEYFTSSFAYMCGMALLLGAEEIGVWGFEMSTGTEFRYQKGSTEFWLGIASQRCKRVQLTPNCRLLSGAKYAYEVSRMYNRQRIEMLHEHKKLKLEQAKQKAFIASGAREQLEKMIKESKDEAARRAYSLQAKKVMEDEINKLMKASEFAGQVGLLDAMLKELDSMKTIMNVDPDWDRKSADKILEEEDKAMFQVEGIADEQTPSAEEPVAASASNA